MVQMQSYKHIIEAEERRKYSHTVTQAVWPLQG